MRADAMLVAFGLLVPAAAAALEVPVPRVEVEGKTDGEAALSAAMGFTAAIGRRLDATPWLTFEVTSKDGLATLLSLKRGSDGVEDTTPRPWAMGGTLTFRWWGPDTPRLPAVELEAARATAYARCTAQCRSKATDDKGEFCALREKYVGWAQTAWLETHTAGRAPSDYCQEQQEAMKQLDQAVAERRVTLEVAKANRAKAFAACLAPCAPDSVATADKRVFCEAHPGMPYEVAPDAIGSDQYCLVGQQIVKNLVKRHPETVSHQIPMLVNFGGQGGGETYKHLAPDPANAGQVKAVETTVHPWSFGTSGAWLPRSGGATPTIEWLAVYGFAYEGAEDKARFCVPGGNVSQDGGGTVPATICKDVDATPPTRGHRTRVGLLVGAFDQVANSWRISAGGELAGNAGQRWRKTAQVPIHLQVASTTGYKGLLRVTPSVAFGGDPKAGTVWAISIALLGQRGFFSEKFDRL